MTTIGIALFLSCLGCGTVVMSPAGPNISQVLPQTIAVGSQNVSMRVVGTNFTNKAVILWNGSKLATSMVDDTTLVGTVDSRSLAAPAVAQLQVQNSVTGQQSQSLPVSVVSPASVSAPTPGDPGSATAPTAGVATLAIYTSALASGAVGNSYAMSLSAMGGTPAYTWSVTSGTLPSGVTLSATTGTLSGTPTKSGTYSFGVTVKDAGSPVQAARVALTMTVSAQAAPQALRISSSTLPGATVAELYGGSLSATGGKAPYTWSVSSGVLPAGLKISASTGVISGVPTASGAGRFTVTVKDSSSPAQTASAADSIVVAGSQGNPLSITSSALSSGTDSIAYSAALKASGGTPAYTWSITSGKLPAGLTMAATTGTISGTPTATGTASFTAAVTDNGNPVQTKSVATSITVAAKTTQVTGPGTTWYIRSDGGTRYSANVTTGQCDGQADAAYGGSGTNQHCAFNDFRYLWDDNSGHVGLGAWVIAGGDTVIVRGCAALPGQQNSDAPHCRIGWDKSTNSGSDKWCYSVGSYGCYNPPIPAGTATQHTRILGQNYANCNVSGATNPKLYASNLTQLFGGFSVLYVLNLQSTSYVDVQCIELTQHNGVCVRVGAPAYPRGCSSNQPLDDYATGGIVTNNATSNVTMQDVYIHGFNSTGLDGPIGGPINMTRMFIGFNTFAGWNFDDGHSTPDAPGSSITATHVIMEGNGCQEQYPIKDAFPAMVCYDSDHAGFGDSWSGQNTALDSMICDDCQMLYNTKDGFIGPHTWITTLVIKNSASIGNMGQDWKWGGNASPNNTTFVNNLTVGNCNRMSQPLPGAPANYNQYLSLFCRAAGMVVGSAIPTGSTWTIANNTWITYQPTTFYIACPANLPGPCPSTVNFTNNIFLGYTNPSQPSFSGQGPALYYINDASIHRVAKNNVEYGLRNGDCQNGATGNICLDPMLVGEPAYRTLPSESTLDNFNFHLTSGSPAIGAGAVYSGLPATDYYGNPISTLPVIGAVAP